MPFLGDEDFLVISGDAVCDLDLKQAMDFHATRRPAATLVLHRHPTPLEYGLVLTDPEGRVERFVEKPAWGQVVTNQVNTGIYPVSYTHLHYSSRPEKVKLLFKVFSRFTAFDWI